MAHPSEAASSILGGGRSVAQLTHSDVYPSGAVLSTMRRPGDGGWERVGGICPMLSPETVFGGIGQQLMCYIAASIIPFFMYFSVMCRAVRAIICSQPKLREVDVQEISQDFLNGEARSNPTYPTNLLLP